MHKVLALVSGAICLFSASIAAAAPSAQKHKSFAQWCLQRKSVPVDTRHTIDVLLKEAGTNNCQRADAKLRNLTTLLLNFNQIVDVKPLAGLSNLTALWLHNNQIVDVKPLAGLSKLMWLRLDGNQVVDVKPLTGLSNLKYLSLKGNQITVKVCPVKPESICKFSGSSSLDYLR